MPLEPDGDFISIVAPKTKNSIMKKGMVVQRWGTRFRPANSKNKGLFGIIVEVLPNDEVEIMVSGKLKGDVEI